MNKHQLLLTLFIFFLSSTFCLAQTKLYDLLHADFEKIQKVTKDPIIIVGPKQTYWITSIRMEPDTNVIIWEWYYLIYKERNRSYATRYVETIAPYKKKKLFKSKPMEIFGDSLFSFLKGHEPMILSQEVLPFIYHDTIKGQPVYKEGVLMHTYPYSLSVHFDQNSFQTFEFEDIAMREYLMPGNTDLPKNLNFNYNRMTGIFQVYSFLENLFFELEEKFEFP